MLLEFYKVTMGTFLVIFVPQQCGNDVCSLSQNFSNDAPLNRVALACNFAAFATVLGFYGVEIKRENWSIERIDELIARWEALKKDLEVEFDIEFLFNDCGMDITYYYLK